MVLNQISQSDMGQSKLDIVEQIAEQIKESSWFYNELQRREMELDLSGVIILALSKAHHNPLISHF